MAVGFFRRRPVIPRRGPIPERAASPAMFRMAAALMALLAVAQAGQAQIDTKSKAPIDITANEAEVINSKCVAIWRGAAEAVQGPSRLRADTISVFSRPKGGSGRAAAATASPEPMAPQASCGGAERIVAEGHVYYVNAQQSARGDHAVYTQASDEIVITGNVIVVQGEDVARGDRLVLKVGSREARMELNVTGAGRPHRVRGVFYPNQADKPVASRGAAPP